MASLLRTVVHTAHTCTHRHTLKGSRGSQRRTGAAALAWRQNAVANPLINLKTERSSSPSLPIHVGAGAKS